MPSQEPEVAARVGGVYTWGAPRAGDAAFARAFTTAYGDRSFRIRHAGDIVTSCPVLPLLLAVAVTTYTYCLLHVLLTTCIAYDVCCLLFRPLMANVWPSVLQ